MSIPSRPLDYAEELKPNGKSRRPKISLSGADRVPDVTLEAISRTFYAEAVKYGFKHLDYVRFVNLILDHAMQQFSQRSNGRRVKDIAGFDDSMAHFTPQVPPGLPLHGDRVTVRAFNGEPDIQHLELWTRDGLGKRFLLSRTSSQQSALRDVVKESSSVFGIIQAPAGEPIGCVTFLNYDRAQRKAELRKLIGSPAHRGQGLAREASALWIQYGIQALGLKKIYLNTFETDIRNIRLNERLGFKVEGILRGEVVVNDVRRDVLRMGLVVDDLIGDEGTEM